MAVVDATVDVTQEVGTGKLVNGDVMELEGVDDTFEVSHTEDMESDVNG